MGGTKDPQLLGGEGSKDQAPSGATAPRKGPGQQDQASRSRGIVIGPRVNLTVVGGGQGIFPPGAKVVVVCADDYSGPS